jgi:hypothetical protein
MRLIAIKRIEENLKQFGEDVQLTPNWNPRACDYFEKFDVENETSGRHARNGKEFYIDREINPQGFFGIGPLTHTAEGFKISKGDFFFVYDSDLEYDHLRSIYMMRYAERNKLDVVFGSRFKKNDSMIIKIIERPYFFGTVICTYLINKFYKKNFTDIIGAKLFRIAAIRKVAVDNFHTGYDFNFTSKILKMKLNVGEVFIKYKPREKGQKKLKYYHLFNAVYQIFKVKFLS